MRRALRALSTVLIVSGLALLIDAGLTLVWQEPISALVATINQGRLSDELRELEDTEPTQLQLATLARLGTDQRRIAYLARELRREAGEGEAIGRIEIPAIDVDFVTVHGTEAASLRKGPGHYPDTPLPGLRGTVAIAGHRTTYLAPFRDIDQLGRGDRVVLEMPYATFTYEYERQRIVEPTDLAVLDRRPYDRLVLTACHPLYSAAQRIVVFARLVSVETRGFAAAGPSIAVRAAYRAAQASRAR